MKPISVMLRFIVVGAVVLLSWPEMPALAEVRTITATGEYRMGDNDTRTDAKRLALLDAKRLALEQAGVYIESITEVKNFDLAKEEIRAYTAGIVEVVEQATRTMMEGETTVVRVDVKTKIDTKTVAHQIDGLRKNEDLRTQLLRAEHEAVNLRKEMQVRTHELAGAKSKDAVQAISRQRQQLINHADVEALIVRARAVLPKERRSAFILGAVTAEDRQYTRRIIEEALAHEPENLEAQGLLGVVEFQEGNLQKATATLRRVAGSEPPSGQAHLNLGMVLDATGYVHSALEEYKVAVTLEPNNAEAHAALAGGYLAGPFLTSAQTHEKHASALKELREAIRLAPQNAEYQRRLGGLLPLDAALTQLRKTVALNPSDSLSHIALGRALLKANQDNDAIVEFREAVRIDPGDLNAYEAYECTGEAFEKLGQMDQAIEAYRKSIETYRNVSGGRVSPLLVDVDRLSGALQKVGKRKEAAQVYRDQLKTLQADSPYAALYRTRLEELEQEQK